MENKKGTGKSCWDKLFPEVGKQVNGFTESLGLGSFLVEVAPWKKHRKMDESPQKPEL